MSENSINIDETIHTILSENKDKNTTEVRVKKEETPVGSVSFPIDTLEITDGRVYYMSKFWNYHH